MAIFSFASDYLEGAHPTIIENLAKTNLWQTPGYGTDDFCIAAQEKIRAACAAPDALVQFLVGGTQTNAAVIDALLHGYQAALAADTGHINLHEAGAIEFGGHKVLTLPHENGKLTAARISEYLDDFYAADNRDHLAQPGLIYISQPTEYGTLYSKQELLDIRKVCQNHALPLYIDGARLAYALACPENDLSLADLARIADVFYIGGTKCGALFGEAVVAANPKSLPHFFTTVKQHGALLAKGRLLGIQFGTLFTDDLYAQLGATAIKFADEIRQALQAKGYRLLFDTPTNQIFVILTNEQMAQLAEQVDFTVWGKFDAAHTVIRLVTSWATSGEAVKHLLESI